MKRIAEYKKLFAVEGELELKQLKKTYRNLVEHKSVRLEVTFANGACYEYFGVPKKVYIKLINSDKRQRFAKRSIFNSYLYRKSKKEVEA